MLFPNRTRRSRSIPVKLLKRGRVLEIPLYYTLRLSDLAREGIDHSGSYRFADHIYRGEPSGRGWFGRWLDARLLSMPGARSFRNRYLAASDAIAHFLIDRTDRPLHILSVPCGRPRELARGARIAAETRTHALDGVTFHGLDLDPDVLREATALAGEHGLKNFVAHRGNALTLEGYPAGIDFITCTGFGEFLSDAELERLYGIFYAVLRPNGQLTTSAMRRHWASDYLLRLAELDTHYRTGDALAGMIRRSGFRDVTARIDSVGLQSIVTARK